MIYYKIWWKVSHDLLGNKFDFQKTVSGKYGHSDATLDRQAATFNVHEIPRQTMSVVVSPFLTSMFQRGHTAWWRGSGDDQHFCWQLSSACVRCQSDQQHQANISTVNKQLLSPSIIVLLLCALFHVLRLSNAVVFNRDWDNPQGTSAPRGVSQNANKSGQGERGYSASGRLHSHNM